jgi:hypothetical protein
LPRYANGRSIAGLGCEKNLAPLSVMIDMGILPVSEAGRCAGRA